jgi:ElaB/YqjD/DUF883 family membrane-anchored ribosome-binding protein
MTTQNGSTSGSIDSIRDNVKNLVDAGQEKAAVVRDALVGAKDKVVSSGQSFFASSRAMIKDNPFAAVGIAFGVGYVAMRIFRR